MTYQKPSELLKGQKLTVGQTISPSGLGWDPHPNFGVIPDFTVLTVNDEGKMILGEFNCKCGKPVEVHPGDLFQKRSCADCKKGKPKTAKSAAATTVVKVPKAKKTVANKDEIMKKISEAKAAVTEKLKAAAAASVEATKAEAEKAAEQTVAAVEETVAAPVEQVESSAVTEEVLKQEDDQSAEEAAAIAAMDVLLRGAPVASKVL
jgi:hypothetical protein